MNLGMRGEKGTESRSGIRVLGESEVPQCLSMEEAIAVNAHAFSLAFRWVHGMSCFVDIPFPFLVFFFTISIT